MKATKLTILSTVLICCLAAVSYAVIPGQESKHNGATEMKTTVEKRGIYETLQGLPECSKFLEYAEKAGVTKELKGTGPMTVLVPTNKAFETLPKECGEKLKNAEHGKKLCTYHILKGNMTLEELQTIEMQETFCENGKETMNCAEIIRKGNGIIQREIQCTNGRIYLINEVLVPACLQKDERKPLNKKIMKGYEEVRKSADEMGKSAAEMTKEAAKSAGEGIKSAYEKTESAISSGLQHATDAVVPSNSTAPVTPITPVTPAK